MGVICMVESVEIEILPINEAFMTYLFPFSFHEKERNKLMNQLKQHQFTFFSLDKKEIENAYYGENIKIQHEELDQFFLPFVEDKLFPRSIDDRGFIRFSKSIAEAFRMEVKGDRFDFLINSVDILLCPFGIGLITIRTEMDEEQKDLSNVLDFMNHFRVLEPKLDEEKGAEIYQNNRVFHTTNELVFDYLCKPLKSFVIQNEKLAGYYGSLPFFEDERMLSSAYIISETGHHITNEQLFRMGQLDGKDQHGKEFISSTNSSYINRFVEKHVHDRWAPNSYTITTEHTQTTITNKSRDEVIRSLNQFMSVHYYNLLLHYFYKIMLLRISFEYSEVKWGKDNDYIEELIEHISKFSSRYYFGEVSVRTEGKELSSQIKEVFHLDYLFGEVKQTLNELYSAQEKQTDKRHNMLLFMLTVFTVVSGIYGMNLVIEDWKGKTDWSKVSGYSFFEWISLITALTGITLSVVMLATTGGKGLLNKYRKWKRDRLK